MEIPIKNEAIEFFIAEKKKFIFNTLSPVTEKLKKRLDEIFTNREIEAMGKINNIHCVQYLIDRYVDDLYSKE